jgi:hypothetical protein
MKAKDYPLIPPSARKSVLRAKLYEQIKPSFGPLQSLKTGLEPLPEDIERKLMKKDIDTSSMYQEEDIEERSSPSYIYLVDRITIPKSWVQKKNPALVIAALGHEAGHRYAKELGLLGRTELGKLFSLNAEVYLNQKTVKFIDKYCTIKREEEVFADHYSCLKLGPKYCRALAKDLSEGPSVKPIHMLKDVLII